MCYSRQGSPTKHTWRSPRRPVTSSARPVIDSVAMQTSRTFCIFPVSHRLLSTCPQCCRKALKWTWRGNLFFFFFLAVFNRFIHFSGGPATIKILALLVIGGLLEKVRVLQHFWRGGCRRLWGLDPSDALVIEQAHTIVICPSNSSMGHPNTVTVKFFSDKEWTLKAEQIKERILHNNSIHPDLSARVDRMQHSYDEVRKRLHDKGSINMESSSRSAPGDK